MDSKPHYLALDGLRGVAALIVVLYHIGEGYATSPTDQMVNHGYLAVDFFFLLSGFVIGYAYDNRWERPDFNTWTYFKRRLIRLHPMVVLGAGIGLASYLLQGSVRWDGSEVALGWVLLASVLTMLMIPTHPGAPYDVRGNGEIFPLNGPSWSLFFEYLGNVLYALVLRRASTIVLKVIVLVSGVGLTWYGMTGQAGAATLGAGWTLAGSHFLGGSLRLLFSYAMGLLLSRVFRPAKVRGGFWISTVVLVVFLSLPHLGSLWLNGLYESVLVVVIFPILLWLGASEAVPTAGTGKVYTFLGDLSYPLYMVHYPLMYLFYAYLWRDGLTPEESWPVAACVYGGSLVLGYLAMRFYDKPVRARLTLRSNSRRGRQ